MTVDNHPDDTIKQQREQMLRLVAKAFYRELVKYGVADNEVLSVANHLLDNVVQHDPDDDRVSETPHEQLSIGSIRDDWSTHGAIHLGNVSLRRLESAQVAVVADWLKASDVRRSFVPALPDERQQIIAYFASEDREYFAVNHEDAFVGIVGAENIDGMNRKLEMKKLIGVDSQRGKGIGTRATFAFLYYAFLIRGVHKVYVHSSNTNVRNLNLNSRLGFELEGIFLEEFKATSTRQLDVVRMGLLKPIWLALFG